MRNLSPYAQGTACGRRGHVISTRALQQESLEGNETPEDMGKPSKTALSPALGQPISRQVQGRVFTILRRKR